MARIMPARRALVGLLTALVASAGTLLALLSGEPAAAGAAQPVQKPAHIVVIYEENHSFDNLYGGWEGVGGLQSADAAHTTQVSQTGTPYKCLLQNDVNLTSPSPLAPSCGTDTGPGGQFQSAFTNAPFQIDDYIAPSDTTCPAPGQNAPNGVPKGSGQPGGCTEDIVHRYYQEQYQLDGGRQDRYATGSDAAGLVMGHYNTRNLPIYQYLHGPGAPGYVIADNFFQAAFGGSFINHQWLVSAQTPVYAGAVNDGSKNDLHSVIDSNGMPRNDYPLYNQSYGQPVRDKALTATCAQAAAAGKPNVGCGDYAVNTIQPPYPPYSSPSAAKLPPLTSSNIGDKLSAANVDWAWYSGGWSNANGDVGGPGWTNGSNGTSCTDPNAASSATYPNCPDKLFQYHHQPFNYYASYAPGTPARKAHLRDEAEFLKTLKGSQFSCDLKPVSFVKPIGEENEHPGYASESQGSSHLVALLQAFENSACWRNTEVIVTYDEFGGQWDHVPPPGQGNANGPADQWGPGTRIPALILSRGLPGGLTVDHTEHDTTSVLATIEHVFGLAPLSGRDANVPDLLNDYPQIQGGGNPGPGPVVALHLRAKPNRVRANRRSCITFTATALGETTSDVTVRFARRTRITDENGVARFCVRLKPGRYRAVATLAGYRSASARVRAVAAKKHAKHPKKKRKHRGRTH